MNTTYETTLLEDTASTGRKKFWIGRVLTDGADWYTSSESWQHKTDGSDSEHVVSTPKRIQGKNIGKSNETHPSEQARLEIDSQWRKKQDKGYRPADGSATTANAELVLPMLAHSFDKRGHHIEYPAYVQPKLDGVRCITDGVRFWSRQGKEYSRDVVAHLISDIPDGVYLDGELMLCDTDKYTFQDTIRAVKKYRPGVSEELVLTVYDIILTDKPKATYEERLKYLNDHLDKSEGVMSDNIDFLQTLFVMNEREMREMHDQFVSEGHEGLMIRNAKGVYKRKHRSADLQKVKEFQDEEFEVVSYTEGQGKDEGTVVFYCRTPYSPNYEKPIPVSAEAVPGLNDQTLRELGIFKARPRGTHAQRSKWFDNGDQIIGTPLTVRYQGVSEDGMPRFPVGVGLRPDWDL